MRHQKHRHQLGVKKAHRLALMANMASSLIIHGKIQTTLAKAKALRPFIEKVITLAKKAQKCENAVDALHFRRQALSKIRNKEAVAILFNEKVSEFENREGGYARIYKLGNRIGDAAEMALIELIAADDEGYSKPKKKPAKKAAKSKKTEAKKEETVEVATEEAEVVAESAEKEEESK